MTVVPAVAPVTIPVVAPTPAMVVMALDHEPPAVASVNVIVPPTQTEPAPDMAVGLARTVTD